MAYVILHKVSHPRPFKVKINFVRGRSVSERPCKHLLSMSREQPDPLRPAATISHAAVLPHPHRRLPICLCCDFATLSYPVRYFVLRKRSTDHAVCLWYKPDTLHRVTYPVKRDAMHNPIFTLSSSGAKVRIHQPNAAVPQSLSLSLSLSLTGSFPNVMFISGIYN